MTVQIDPARTALVLLDYQNYNVHPDINPHTPWQADAKAATRSTEGTWGIEFVDALAPLEEELVVRKRAVSGFAGTELDRLLRVHDVSTLVIAGIITNFAAEGG